MSSIGSLFDFRDHGNGLLEIISIHPGMGQTHSLFKILPVLAKKFNHIIINLQTGSYFTPDALPALLAISAQTPLSVVSTGEVGIPAEKAGISVYDDISKATRRIASKKILEHLLKEMDSIPQLNSKAFEALQQINKPTTTFADLVTLTANDIGLVSQILKTANSAFFMRRNKVETLDAALAFLGMEGIKQILVYNVFKGLSSFFGAQKAVIDHGNACAYLSGKIAEMAKVDRLTVGKIRLSGMLHDIGSFALAYYYPKEYEAVMQKVKSGNIKTFEAELEVFGIDHQEIGKELLTKWSFPDYLVHTAANHHGNIGEEHSKIITPVLCANGYLNEVIDGISFVPYEKESRVFLGKDESEVTLDDLKTIFAMLYEEFLASQIE